MNFESSSSTSSSSSSDDDYFVDFFDDLEQQALCQIIVNNNFIIKLLQNNQGSAHRVCSAMVETLENSSAQDMEIEAAQADDTSTENGVLKRPREETTDDKPEKDEAGDPTTKKPKLEKSVEEQRLEKTEAKANEEDKDDDSCRVKLGPKTFGSSVEMYDYFCKLLRSWTPNINVNQYEHTVLLELLKKGHLEPEKKIGKGIRLFQVRYHPQYKSRCFFLVREDESVDDFSFRKCVDHILPLPENMQSKHDFHKAFAGGGKRGGGGGRGGGRGRGKSRN